MENLDYKELYLNTFCCSFRTRPKNESGNSRKWSLNRFVQYIWRIENFDLKTFCCSLRVRPKDESAAAASSLSRHPPVKRVLHLIKRVLHFVKRDLSACQKSTTLHQKSTTFNQKSPIVYRKTPILNIQNPIYMLNIPQMTTPPSCLSEQQYVLSKEPHILLKVYYTLSNEPHTLPGETCIESGYFTVDILEVDIWDHSSIHPRCME